MSQISKLTSERFSCQGKLINSLLSFFNEISHIDPGSTIQEVLFAISYSKTSPPGFRVTGQEKAEGHEVTAFLAVESPLGVAYYKPSASPHMRWKTLWEKWEPNSSTATGKHANLRASDPPVGKLQL